MSIVGVEQNRIILSRVGACAPARFFIEPDFFRSVLIVLLEPKLIFSKY